MVSTEARHRGISISEGLAPLLPGVLGDAIQLGQVVINLLLNGPQIYVVIRISCLEIHNIPAFLGEVM